MANNNKKSVGSTKKSTAKKSPARKKNSDRRPLKVIVDKPIRIILELVIKDERSPGGSSLLGGETRPVINYQFALNQCVVTNLSIQDKNVSNPGLSGSITLDHLPLSGNVLVAAMATGASASSTGTLQLTYLQRALFNPAEPFKFSGAMGFINTSVKLT